MIMGGYTVKIDAPPRAIQHIKDGRFWHTVRKKTDQKKSKEELEQINKNILEVD